MNREAWKAFAGALRGFLVLAVVIAVPATVLILTSPTVGTEEVVAAWKTSAHPPATLVSLGNVSIIGFLVIPVIAYAAALIRYGTNRQWSYLILVVLQLVILLSAATGVV